MSYEPSPEELDAIRSERDASSPVTRKIIESHTMLPHSPEAEQGAICSFLLAPKEVGGLCIEAGIEPHMFYAPGRSEIFRALANMWKSGSPIDQTTLTQFLRDMGALDRVGGPTVLFDLLNYSPTAANIAYYLEILHDKYALREIIRICTVQSKRSYEYQDDVHGILEETERQIFELTSARHGRHSKRRSMKELVMSAVTNIQEVYERRGAISGLSTGFPLLDSVTDGLHPGELIVLAARPSHGKTSLAMNIAEHIAIEQKKHVAVFSLEMSAQQLVQRLLCSRAKVSMAKVRDGFLSERDFPALMASASKLSESLIHIEEGSDMTIDVLRARARALKASYNIEALFVDSLSVLRCHGKKDRWLEVAAATNGLKEAAKELGIPVVVIAHLGREAEGESRPKVSQLRESGNIEQDADGIWFLIREELFAADDEKADKLAGKANLRIGKGRMGDMNVNVPLTYLKEYARFETRAVSPDEEASEELPTTNYKKRTSHPNSRKKD